MTDWRAVSESIVACLRSCKCWCIRNYDMKVVSQCSKCRGIEEYESAVKDAAKDLR